MKAFFSVGFALLGLLGSWVEAKDKICLNMIVKDEEAVIERALSSVKPFIDYWVVVDTGSHDGTKEKVKQCLSSIPGELHETQWKNFEFNRNQALELARTKGDYILFIDADEYLIADPSFKLPEKLDKEGYLIKVTDGQVEFLRMLLISCKKPWMWKGVVHETIYSPLGYTSEVLQGLENRAMPEGARSKDPFKYEKDAALLEEALIQEPDNSRYVFYLGQSYLCAGQYEKALEAYERRSRMAGWDQEVFWSLYSMARIKERLKKPDSEVIWSYNQAFEYRPSRAEPLLHLASIFLKNEMPHLAIMFLKEAKTLKSPPDGIYLEKDVYEYGLDLQLGEAYLQVGQTQEAAGFFQNVIHLESVPLAVYQRAKEQFLKIVHKAGAK